MGRLRDLCVSNGLLQDALGQSIIIVRIRTHIRICKRMRMYSKWTQHCNTFWRTARPTSPPTLKLHTKRQTEHLPQFFFFEGQGGEGGMFKEAWFLQNRWRQQSGLTKQAEAAVIQGETILRNLLQHSVHMLRTTS